MDCLRFLDTTLKIPFFTAKPFPDRTSEKQRCKSRTDLANYTIGRNFRTNQK
jgi:hypothetical protein